MLNMDDDDEGLLYACEMYEMTLINLITMDDDVHHRSSSSDVERSQ